MKKITLILMLLSFCTLASAQDKKSKEKEKARAEQVRTENAATPPSSPPRAIPKPTISSDQPKPPPAKPATGLVTIKLNSSKCNGYNHFVVLEDLENKNNRYEIWFDQDCKAVEEVPVGRYEVQFNLRYTDQGCDGCENPAKIKRVNTNCSGTILNLGKNKTVNLSCYKSAE